MILPTSHTLPPHISWVLPSHAQNQVADHNVGPWPTTTYGARLPSPVSSEASAMPADDSFGLDDDQSITPACPEAVEEDPENAISCSQLRTGLLVFEYAELLAECHVLQSEIELWSEQAADYRCKGCYESHSRRDCSNRGLIDKGTSDVIP